MEQYIGPRTRPLALCLAVGVVVCDGACKASRDADRLTVGEARAVAVSNGSLAPGVTPDLRKRGMIPPATSMVLLSNVAVCTDAYRPGDSFTATVADTVQSPIGIIIPAGSLATFRVTEVSPSTARNGTAQIGIALDSLDIDGVRYPATAVIKSIATRRVQSSRSVHHHVLSGVGPVGGGMLGERLGRRARSPDTSAAGAARSAGSKTSPRYDVCIPRLGRITAADAAVERR
jgi:hypothetical protein